MIWAIAATVAGLAALVWVLAFAPTWPRHTTPAGRHRAHDATDPPEMAWLQTLDADTLPNIRVEVAAELAATAVAGIPLPVLPEQAADATNEAADPERTGQ